MYLMCHTLKNAIYILLNIDTAYTLFENDIRLTKRIPSKALNTNSKNAEFRKSFLRERAIAPRSLRNKTGCCAQTATDPRLANCL